MDTEGDNLWARPREVSTRNAAFLPRFHELCRRYALKPTYLVNYEMAQTTQFRDFGSDVLRSGSAEIGMHLHAWNTPPLIPLTDDDFTFQPFLIEYPATVMRQKIATVTHLLEDAFGVKMVSHRAGRWGLDGAYAKMLVDAGYLADCSITPHVSWKAHRGSPHGDGGPDYSHFPEDPYFLNLDDISQAGASRLLEVPATVVRSGRPDLPMLRRLVHPIPAGRRVLNRIAPPVYWLRPDRRNLPRMLRIVRDAVRDGRRHLEFVIHSSELMPGGSPIFQSHSHIEHLYADLEVLFETVRDTCAGLTLSEYRAECRPTGPSGPAVRAG